MSGAQYELVGEFNVALPPDEAFILFTPRGEETWVPGWRPRFPVPAEDDTEPGTVFETVAHGETTTWVVLDGEQGRRISYARVTPGHRAGTVGVAVDGDGDGRSTVQVTHALTALGSDGEKKLEDFAAGYPAFLKSWEATIASMLST